MTFDTENQTGRPDAEDLDALLDRSAPPVSVGSSAVRDELYHVVLASRAGVAAPRAASRWSARRVAIGSGAAAFALAGVTAAAASPMAPEWMGGFVPDVLVSDGVGSCELQGLAAMPQGTTSDDPAVIVARDYLIGLDLGDVDYSDELAEQRGTPVSGEDGSATGETADDVYSEQALRSAAFFSAVAQMVGDEVERQGLDRQLVSLESRGTGCGDLVVP